MFGLIHVDAYIDRYVPVWLLIYSLKLEMSFSTRAYISHAEAIRLCREYAMEKFDEAQESDYYVCGMQPFDVDDPMYGVILAREGLECHHHVEYEYYNNPKILTSSFNAKLCAYCAREPMDLLMKN